jgi:serine/threonine-protein kinase
MHLAVALTAMDRDAGDVSTTAIDKEIGVLESQANPLDRDASEARVRRLAFLKRSRRAVAEIGRKRQEMLSKLETCSLALQGMKFDVLKLKTGNQSWQQLTTIAGKAMALAREEDAAVYAGDAVNRLDRPAAR